MTFGEIYAIALTLVLGMTLAFGIGTGYLFSDPSTRASKTVTLLMSVAVGSIGVGACIEATNALEFVAGVVWVVFIGGMAAVTIVERK